MLPTIDWNAVVIFDVIDDNDEHDIDGSGVCQNTEFGSRLYLGLQMRIL